MNKQIETMKQVAKVFNAHKQTANRNDDMGVVQTDIESSRNMHDIETFIVTVDEAGKMNITVKAKGFVTIEKEDVTIDTIDTALAFRIAENSDQTI